MNVIIRELQPSDAEVSWTWRNDPEIWNLTGRNWNNFVTKEIEEDWIAKVIQNKNEKRFAICVGDNKKYVGNVQLTNINNESAEFHIFIGDKSYWGNGIATKATELILSFAEELKIKKVFLEVKQTNTAAIKVYKKNGFVVANTFDDKYLMVYSLNKEPLVSICMITYNHEKFIAQAIEGVLMQKTNFQIELIIGEDCSTDNTRKICLEYKEKYREKIKLLLPEKNLGVHQNSINTLLACTGKYIAICEGDDYWTDPDKLQKQVDFLEANQEYTLCSHCYKIYDEVSKEWNVAPGYSIFENSNTEGLTIDRDSNFSTTWLTHTLTIVFRKNAIDLSALDKYEYFRDIHLYYHLLRAGKGYCMNFEGAVYRQHLGGIYSKISDTRRNFINYKVFSELFYSFPEDIMLKNNYLYLRNLVFNSFQERFCKKKYAKALRTDIFLFIRNEYKMDGFKGTWYCISKIILYAILSLKK